MGAATVTWRNGAEGCAFAGKCLCNGCAIFAVRHPDLDEVSTLSAVLVDAAGHDVVACVLPE